MRSVLAAALILSVGFGAAGCRSAKTTPGGTAPASSAKEKTPLRRDIQEYRVIWTRGGKLGYLKTYAYSRGPDTPVRVHEVENLENRQVGWITDSGEGERFDFLDPSKRASRRVEFERVPLPTDTMENQVRRIFSLDPLTEIAVTKAGPADIRQ